MGKMEVYSREGRSSSEKSGWTPGGPVSLPGSEQYLIASPGEFMGPDNHSYGVWVHICLVADGGIDDP